MLASMLAPGALAAAENIALGKPYVLSRKPTYPYCRDPGDASQLTDGMHSKVRPKFWSQKSTVGWYATNGKPVTITIDLGSALPISGVTCSMGAGCAGVRWPLGLVVHVSDDGKAWREAGDLVALSNRESAPPSYGTYGTHAFSWDRLDARGRWVKLSVIPRPHYAFIDEIEVWRGADRPEKKSRRAMSEQEVSDRIAQFMFSHRLKSQLRHDLGAVEEDLEGLGERQSAALQAKLGSLRERIEEPLTLQPDGFKAILPMCDLERTIFRLQAEVWRVQGKPILRVWKAHRWDHLAPSQDPPPGAPDPRLAIRLMRNEHRADVLNLTNAADTDLTVQLQIRSLPGGTNPEYIRVHEVLHVGTKDHCAVAAALPRVLPQASRYRVTVPSGTTRQVWLACHSMDLDAGIYDGTITGQADDGATFEVPIHIRVYPLRFPDRTRLILSGWDYTDREAIYGLTPQNRDVLITHLREHIVNATWASSRVLTLGLYDEQGDLVQDPDTRHFDAWVGRWPNAESYLVFRNVAGGEFAGSKIGTPLCDRKLASWIRFWVGHLREVGLRPGQLAILPVDEPHDKRQYEINTAFARPVKKAAPEVNVWINPTPKDTVPCREMMDRTDFLCAHWLSWATGGDAYRDPFRRRQEAAKQLWFYNVPPMSDIDCLLDPYPNYLLRAWYCFDAGATGSGFWCFVDTGQTSIWNPYHPDATRTYCPVYLEPNRLTPAKYMEAIREGVEDYEYLTMLRDRVTHLQEKGGDSPALRRAAELLATAPDRVLAPIKDLDPLAPFKPLDWRTEQDRSVADKVRVEILEALAGLAEEH